MKLAEVAKLVWNTDNPSRMLCFTEYKESHWLLYITIMQ